MLCRWTLFSLFAVSLIHLIKADGCEDKKPDFSAPNRRISEQKCREYNWERKHLEKCSTDAANIKYPYMGALGYKRENETSWSFLCASFLISPKFAVTAAHCSKAPTEYSPPEIIRFGNENIFDDVPRQDVKIRRIIRHPEFKPPSKYYDIALLELESEVPFSKSIYPACLWSQAALDGVEYAYNQAWGLESVKGKQRKVIAEMKVKVLDDKTCADTVKPWFNRLFRELKDHHLCADESISTVNNCQGSAGAPLITAVGLDGNNEDEMPYAIAVSSFGRGCRGIGVYTKVSSFIDWIEQTVWPEAGSAN